MKRIIPYKVYDGIPCSVVAVGCAMGITDTTGVNRLLESALNGLFGAKLHDDGYLPLDGLNGLIRANMPVRRREIFRKGERPSLNKFVQEHLGQPAVICVLGHYLYFDGANYYSFFDNDTDAVVSVWYLC